MLETKLVVSAAAFHATWEDEMKFVPVAVKVKATPPDAALAGLIPAITGTGFWVGPVPPVPPPAPPQPMFNPIALKTMINNPVKANRETGRDGTFTSNWLAKLESSSRLDRQYQHLSENPGGRGPPGT